LLPKITVNCKDRKMDYVYFSGLLLIAVCTFMSVVYITYRRGIALRLGIIAAGSLAFVACLGFVLGKEGISLVTACIALACVPPVTFLWRTAFRQIITPIRNIANIVEEIAHGDLSRKPEMVGKDELGAMVVSFQNMVDSLNEALWQASEVVTQVVSSAEQLRQLSQSMSSSAEEQAAASEEVASSLEETDARIRANAESTAQANQLVAQAARVADLGREKMVNMTRAMNTIAASSQQIGKIIKVVDEIAFQTNMLALNAAVEAARAGQYGRGFAVVAQEVRNLAERSARAARETAELVEDSSRRVMEGVTIANETAEALGEIIHTVTRVRDLMAEIAAASEEQAQSVTQIGSAIAQVNQGAQLVSQQSEELAATADELGQMVAALHSQVARFKLGKKRETDVFAGIPPYVIQRVVELVRAQMKVEDMATIPAGIACPASGEVAEPMDSQLEQALDRDERGYSEF